VSHFGLATRSITYGGGRRQSPTLENSEAQNFVEGEKEKKRKKVRSQNAESAASTSGGEEKKKGKGSRERRSTQGDAETR